ncbi:hypothetical protein R3P38DRAFT_2807888 [Favolaschia claudopus]|uniref:GATA-type domain-containing protein n=1 Tax=Favolaschia claudopus TaxID=2862362 RepID=A0AAV9ZHZ3_9AGAR
MDSPLSPPGSSSARLESLCFILHNGGYAGWSEYILPKEMYGLSMSGASTSNTPPVPQKLDSHHTTTRQNNQARTCFDCGATETGKSRRQKSNRRKWRCAQCGPLKHKSRPSGSKRKGGRGVLTQTESCRTDAAPVDQVPNALIVYDWREKLQRVFFPRNKALPDIELMSGMDTLFTIIEESQGITRFDIAYLKIAKIMRHINRLEPKNVPRNSDFRFCARAGELVKKWRNELGYLTSGALIMGSIDVV